MTSPQALRHLPAVAAVGAVRAACPKSATWTSRSWCSSSTKRTCCSTMRRKALLEKIEQVVRLIRSKGVGVYFVTQNPLDIPDTVLGQLGNRVQHALRAFTPRDQKAVQVRGRHDARQSQARRRRRRSPNSASARRWSPSSTRRAGPAIVERAFVLPPGSRIGPISGDERKALIASSLVAGVSTRRPVSRPRSRSLSPSQFISAKARAEQTSGHWRRDAHGRSQANPGRTPRQSMPRGSRGRV